MNSFDFSSELMKTCWKKSSSERPGFKKILDSLETIDTNLSTLGKISYYTNYINELGIKKLI